MSKKSPNHKEQLIIPVYYYEYEQGNITYDFEEMANVFENELSLLDDSVVVMCSVDSKEEDED